MEQLTNFQFVWKEWITPLISDLEEQLDPNFKSFCNVRVRDLDKICIKAESYYQRKREEMKVLFYGNYQKGDSVTEHRMDFHKIGAIICRTLIEYKVFDFDIDRCKEYIGNIDSYDTDWVVKNALINFRLAFYGSIVFLYHAMQFEYYNDDRILYDKLNKKEKLDLYEIKRPDTSKKVKESFENCIVLDLAKRDIGNRSFDFFMYAVVLYQLEEHNKSLLVNAP